MSKFRKKSCLNRRITCSTNSPPTFCRAVTTIGRPWNLPRGTYPRICLDRSQADNGAREWTGYGAPENRDAALERWSFLTTAPNVSRCVKAQAYSCLAAGWFERAIEDPERWNIDSLHRAGSNANEAIALGITGTVSLKLGFSIQSHGLRRPEDNRFPGLSTDRFERLADLWEAIDARTAEMERVAAKKEVKAPLKYACSADDCGVQATKRSGLFRCAGKCPVVFKPSYCSKECQKLVRCFYLLSFFHRFRAVCLAGLETAQTVL